MDPDTNQLRAGSLSFVEVLAASLALIGLSMTPVLIAPYMYGAAGNGSWVAYVFAAVMLLLVAVNLNHFAKRATGSGSMFLYAAKELGPAVGTIAGWSLVWAYVFVGAAQFGAQPLFIGQLAHALGVPIPAIAVMIGLGVVCCMLAVRDVALSTVVMLVLETISVVIICILIVDVFTHRGFIDAAQIHLEGVGRASIGLGIATAIFSFVGFESATAFGDEARNALQTIPRAVVLSVVIAAAFFMFSVYAEILGLRGSKPPLDQMNMPLWNLADALDASYLKVPIAVGAICSSFSVALACLNTAARIVLPMAHDGLLPKALAAVHPRFRTPHVALGVIVAVMFSIGLAMYAGGVAPIDIFNFCGTLSSLSFIAVYLIISMAAPRLLARIGELKPVHVVASLASCAFLIAAAVTLFYPVPPAPTNVFPYLFLLYLALGLALYALARRKAATETS